MILRVYFFYSIPYLHEHVNAIINLTQMLHVF